MNDPQYWCPVLNLFLAIASIIYPKKKTKAFLMLQVVKKKKKKWKNWSDMGDNSENDKCRAEKEYFVNEWIYYWFILCELYLMLTKNLQ